MNLEVEGKVSVLMGLAEASANYQHKDESSTNREVISLSSVLTLCPQRLLASR